MIWRKEVSFATLNELFCLQAFYALCNGIGERGAVTSEGSHKIEGCSCLACGFPSVSHGQGHSGSRASKISVVGDPAASVRVAPGEWGKP